MFQDRPTFSEEEFDIYYEDPLTQKTFEPEEEGEDFYEEPIPDKKKEPEGRLSERYNDIYRYYSAYYTW